MLELRMTSLAAAARGRTVACAYACAIVLVLAASQALDAQPATTQPERDWLADERGYEARRESRQRVPDIFAALDVRPGAQIADIGAGRGFFTARLAKAVGPTGRVFAVDVDAKSIARLRERVTREDLTNVEVLEGTQDDARLTPRSLDAALIVNAYHEMVEHAAILAQIGRALKPGAPLVIVEPLDTTLRERTRAQQVAKHSIASRFVVDELREAGYEIASLQDPFVTRGSIDEEWLVVAKIAQRESASASSTAASSTADRLSPTTRIQLDAFKALYDDADVLVIDVRDAESYREGHVPGALLIPLEKIEQHVDALRAEQRLIVAYCSCPAEETSGSAVKKLAQLGITHARALVGGYRLWAARKQPIATGDDPCNGPTCPLKTKASTSSEARRR